MLGFIYKITNVINNKCYIGFTNDPVRRKAEHWSPCRFKLKTKLYCSIRNYGIENFIFEVIYCGFNDEECLKIMEPYFITEYNTIKDGYNLTLGGDRALHSNEVKVKISAAKMGHSVSEETRKKLSISAKNQMQNLGMLERIAIKRRYTFKIIYNNGSTIITKNLKQFCRDNKISYHNFIRRKKMKKLNIINMKKES